MGYQTSFRIRVTHGNAGKLQEILEKEAESEPDGYFSIFDGEGNSDDCYKWYEHEEDMRDLSLKYPNMVFTLMGEGEENGDIWEKDFWNGHIQVRVAEIKVPEFDPTFGGERK